MIEEQEMEQQVIPHQEEKVLLEKRREAIRQRKREEIIRYDDALVALYVYYGESYKMSDRPDPNAAMYCLEKALKLKEDHPVANYRYAHLQYARKDYAKAAYHFKQAVDGNHLECLNDTQTLIAQIFTVNCGILMAKEALKEIDFLKSNQHAVFDGKLKADYIDRLLVDSEEIVAQYLYMKITPLGGQEHISEQQFIEERDQADSNMEVYLCLTPKEREIVYHGISTHLSQTEFYVAHTVLMSEIFIQVKDIHEALYKGPLGESITPAAVRQSLLRLSRNIPFWDSLVESQIRGNHSTRKRRAGINYKMLCHSSQVLL